MGVVSEYFVELPTYRCGKCGQVVTYDDVEDKVYGCLCASLQHGNSSKGGRPLSFIPPSTLSKPTTTTHKNKANNMRHDIHTGGGPNANAHSSHKARLNHGNSFDSGYSSSSPTSPFPPRKFTMNGNQVKIIQQNPQSQQQQQSYNQQQQYSYQQQYQQQQPQQQQQQQLTRSLTTIVNSPTKLKMQQQPLPRLTSSASAPPTQTHGNGRYSPTQFKSPVDIVGAVFYQKSPTVGPSNLGTQPIVSHALSSSPTPLSSSASASASQSPQLHPKHLSGSFFYHGNNSHIHNMKGVDHPAAHQDTFHKKGHKPRQHPSTINTSHQHPSTTTQQPQQQVHRIQGYEPENQDRGVTQNATRRPNNFSQPHSGAQEQQYQQQPYPNQQKYHETKSIVKQGILHPLVTASAHHSHSTPFLTAARETTPPSTVTTSSNATTPSERSSLDSILHELESYSMLDAYTSEPEAEPEPEPEPEPEGKNVELALHLCGGCNAGVDRYTGFEILALNKVCM
jgi:hypothetical protein